jgi:hypothetical protein
MNQLAKAIVDIATGNGAEVGSEQKDPSAAQPLRLFGTQDQPASFWACHEDYVRGPFSN